MFQDKEAQLKRYYEISLAMLEALQQGSENEVPPLLEQREGCISTIKKLDKEAGTVLMNERIKEQLTELAKLEEEIQTQFEQTMRKLGNLIRSAQNDQQVKSYYEEQSTVSKGVFYDRKK